MKVNLLAFGIARDILGYQTSDIGLEDATTIRGLKDKLSGDYPAFVKLAKFDIAVNQEYRADDYVLCPDDEVAIIPPVSGG